MTRPVYKVLYKFIRRHTRKYIIYSTDDTHNIFIKRPLEPPRGDAGVIIKAGRNSRGKNVSTLYKKWNTPYASINANLK